MLFVEFKTEIERQMENEKWKMTNGKSSGLQNVERLGWLLDDVFRVPVLGWRFGLDALIGLVPGLLSYFPFVI